MKKTLGFMWVLFLLFSWLIIFLVVTDQLPLSFNIIIVIFGLRLYTWKLHNINNVFIKELNYRTLLYYLMLYIYFVASGICVWGIIYTIFTNVDIELFRKLFTIDEAFWIVARRMILTGSAIGIVGFVIGGLHRSHKSFIFTNKVPLLELLFILIALLWFIFNLKLVGIFVSIIGISTAPDFIKRILSRVLSFIWRRDIDLVNIQIENSSDMDVIGFIDDPRERADDISKSIRMALVDGGKLHLKLALFILTFGGISILHRYH